MYLLTYRFTIIIILLIIYLNLKDVNLVKYTSVTKSCTMYYYYVIPFFLDLYRQDL